MLSLVPTEHWDYGPGDLVRGLRVALSRRRTDKTTTIGIPGVGPSVPIRSGRAAIVIALRALELPAGASVAVPLYCCPVVLRAVAESGYRVRFIDVDPKTYCMSATDLAAKNSEVDAIIAVHMFGNMCDVPALQQAAPGKPVIEDCAQALNSKLGGRAAGSFGDIAIFSFRSGKYISVGEGGAVYCSRAEMESRVSKQIEDLSVSSHSDEIVHVVKTCLRSMLRSRPFWGLIGSALWNAYTHKVDYMSQAPISLGQIYETDREMAIQRMTMLPGMVESQRQNADYYLHNLTIDPDMLCSETPGAYSNRLQFPLLLASSTQCERLAERLRQNQISTARPYRDIAAIASDHYAYKGDCPQAERIANTVLVIPCNYGLSIKQVEWISGCINRAWAEITGQGLGASLTPVPARAIRSSENVERLAEPHHFS